MCVNCSQAFKLSQTFPRKGKSLLSGCRDSAFYGPLLAVRRTPPSQALLQPTFSLFFLFACISKRETSETHSLGSHFHRHTHTRYAWEPPCNNQQYPPYEKSEGGLNVPVNWGIYLAASWCHLLNIMVLSIYQRYSLHNANICMNCNTAVTTRIEINIHMFTLFLFICERHATCALQ